jgi:T4 RnlA family RNA ligase
MLNLITYNEAVTLTIGSDATFYESKFVVDGYNISIFNYRLAQYSDFKVNSAFEMRGLTFVFNKDGSLYKRYILLHKFFNLNQVEESQYSLIKDLEIKSISNKEDGSVASFIRLPNGKVIAKSKMSFDSNQAIGMMRLYNSNKELREFINFTLDNDLVAVFEYVAPDNRIVLRYNKEELILLRLRDNNTGEYLDLTNYLKEIGSIRVAPSEVLTLDKVIELVNNVEDKEGWIIQFTNGLFIKIKTDWYFRLHGLLTNDICRENIIIGYILDDLIDDIIAQIPEDEVESHDRINKIISIVKSSISEKADDILKSYDLFLEGGVGRDWEGDLRLQLMRKSFALKYRKDPNFGYVMSLSKGADVYDLAKDWVRDKTKKLNIARDWLITKDSTLSFLDGDLEGDD